MKRRIPAQGLTVFAGLVAPLVYMSVVVAGGASIPGYDQLRDSISSLTQSGRPHPLWIDLGFAAYNLLIAIFASAELVRSDRDRLFMLPFGLVLVTALCGLLMWPFPQDPIGGPSTVPGTMHLVLAGLESLSTIITIGATFRAFSRRSLRFMAALSVGCLSVTVLFGLLAALALPFRWPLMGLYERLTIGSFEVWIVAMGGFTALMRRRLSGVRLAPKLV